MLKHRNAIRVLAAATVLGVSANARGDGTSPVMAVYDQNTTTPGFRTWTGSAWTSGASMTTAEKCHFIMMQNCPVRNEMACAINSHDSNFWVQFWNGTSWGAATKVCSNVYDNKNRGIDVGYEQVSGKAMVAYWDNGPKNFGYRTYDGTTLSAQSTLSPPSGASETTYVSLVPKRGTNVILLLTIAKVGGSHGLFAAIWNGSSWTAWTTLETNIATKDEECYAGAWETFSGVGLVVWARSGQNQPRYCTISGTSFSGTSLMANIGGVGTWIRLAANPVSDRILFGCLDNAKDINIATWEGSSWGSYVEVTTAGEWSDRRQFDMVFTRDGTKGLAVYQVGTQTALRYNVYDGTNWSAQQIGTDMNKKAQIINVERGAGATTVHIAVLDQDSNVKLTRWDGTSMSATYTTATSTTHGSSYESVALSGPCVGYRSKVVNWVEVVNKAP